LDLDKIPKRIEAFDISSISGRHATGSMVVFLDAEPKKDEYRKYRIRTVRGIDDYAMMREVIGRRYSKHKVPDLILIDGGKGHLNAVLEALDTLKKTGVQILGLAKEFEEIYQPDKKSPTILDPDSEALHLLQRIRDEAHRFAVSYHRVLRSKSMIY
ncbi:MAG: excinuclease ABC subunit C, partial [archaeon]